MYTASAMQDGQGFYAMNVRKPSNFIKHLPIYTLWVVCFIFQLCAIHLVDVCMEIVWLQIIAPVIVIGAVLDAILVSSLLRS